MKLYINLKEMIFEEDNIEHKIVLSASNKKSKFYDTELTLDDNDKFIGDTLKIIYKKNKDGKDTKEIEKEIFMVREPETWWSFPLYEIIDGKIVDFDYKRYAYFNNTDRRMALAGKINLMYNPPSEAKILRKTLRYIMNILNMEYPEFFKKYNDKIEEIINKNPKGDK